MYLFKTLLIETREYLCIPMPITVKFYQEDKKVGFAHAMKLWKYLMCPHGPINVSGSWIFHYRMELQAREG
jgi:hypothetical protein